VQEAICLHFQGEGRHFHTLYSFPSQLKPLVESHIVIIIPSRHILDLDIEVFSIMKIQAIILMEGPGFGLSGVS
jgi:hypothetical protein